MSGNITAKIVFYVGCCIEMNYLLETHTITHNRMFTVAIRGKTLQMCKKKKKKVIIETIIALIK